MSLKFSNDSPEKTSNQPGPPSLSVVNNIGTSGTVVMLSIRACVRACEGVRVPPLPSSWSALAVLDSVGHATPGQAKPDQTRTRRYALWVPGTCPSALPAMPAMLALLYLVPAEGREPALALEARFILFCGVLSTRPALPLPSLTSRVPPPLGRCGVVWCGVVWVCRSTRGQARHAWKTSISALTLTKGTIPRPLEATMRATLVQRYQPWKGSRP